MLIDKNPSGLTGKSADPNDAVFDTVLAGLILICPATIPASFSPIFVILPSLNTRTL
jgi:hypothetical protein